MGLSQKLQKLETYELVVWAINYILQKPIPDNAKLRGIELALVANDLVIKTGQDKQLSKEATRKNEQFENLGPNDPKTISDLALEEAKRKQEETQQVRSK